VRTIIRTRCRGRHAAGVSIARRVCDHANILLCDEPFSALDESTAGKLRAGFVGWSRKTARRPLFHQPIRSAKRWKSATGSWC